MTVVSPCRWCGKTRGIVMIGEEESGIVICKCCDYAHHNAAGPPIPDDRIRDAEVRP